MLFGSFHQDSFIDAGAGMDECDELGAFMARQWASADSTSLKAIAEVLG
ncbi:hypothetical protein [Streptomyces sp. NPDC058424]